MELMKIDRIYQEDSTVGVLNFKGFRCFTLELPNMDNAQNVSCIPAGRYICKKIVSPSLGECIEVENVVGRSFIRIHTGNYTSQIQGCILPGESLVDMNKDGVIDVSSSLVTMGKLLHLAGDDKFQLLIK